MNIKEATKLSRSYNGLPSDDYELFAFIIDRSLRGIKSPTLAIYLGCHYQDWDTIRKLCRQYNQLHSEEKRIIKRRYGDKLFLVRSDYNHIYNNYFTKQKTLVKEASKEGYLKAPKKVRQNIEKDRKERAERRRLAKEEDKRVKALNKNLRDQNYADTVKEISTHMPKQFTLRQLAEYKGITVQGARVHVKRWELKGLVKQVVKAQGGRGQKNIYMWLY